MNTKWILIYSSILVCFFGCSSTRRAAIEQQDFMVILTLPAESESVNPALTAFNLVQKRSYFKLLYPKTTSDTIVIFSGWEKMDVRLIEKIKQYCESIKDKIEVEYESKSK